MVANIIDKFTTIPWLHTENGSSHGTKIQRDTMDKCILIVHSIGSGSKFYIPWLDPKMDTNHGIFAG